MRVHYTDFYITHIHSLPEIDPAVVTTYEVFIPFTRTIKPGFRSLPIQSKKNMYVYTMYYDITKIVAALHYKINLSIINIRKPQLTICQCKKPVNQNHKLEQEIKTTVICMIELQ